MTDKLVVVEATLRTLLASPDLDQACAMLQHFARPLFERMNGAFGAFGQPGVDATIFPVPRPTMRANWGISRLPVCVGLCLVCGHGKGGWFCTLSFNLSFLCRRPISSWQPATNTSTLSTLLYLHVFAPHPPIHLSFPLSLLPCYS